MAASLTIAQLTDVHLGPIAGFSPRYWNLKRFTGYANWLRSRRRVYQRSVFYCPPFSLDVPAVRKSGFRLAQSVASGLKVKDMVTKKRLHKRFNSNFPAHAALLAMAEEAGRRNNPIASISRVNMVDTLSLRSGPRNGEREMQTHATLAKMDHFVKPRRASQYFFFV